VGHNPFQKNEKIIKEIKILTAFIKIALCLILFSLTVHVEITLSKHSERVEIIFKC